jgi:putative inorganic carbon (hco3(-)) transporter
MNSRLRVLAFYLGFASAASILVSIAVSQILLALALVVLLLSGEELQFPPIRLPLAVFFALTVIALAASRDPRGGLPQIRKFYVFLILLVISSTFTGARQLRTLVVVWTGIGSISAAWGLVQFLERWREALALYSDNYGFFLDGRITGLASHWMTFGGEEMIVALMLAALLFFPPRVRWTRYGWPFLGLLWGSIALGMTRSVFLLGLPAGMIYLLWRRRWPAVIVIGTLAVLGATMISSTIRERVVSAVDPHRGVDSNQQRAVARVVGWEMIKAHPWLGLGPEQVGKQFNQYVPRSLPRPLPPGWYGHLHNVYLQYAAERGIPALLAMLWLIGKCLMDFWRYLQHDGLEPEARFVLQGAIAVILAVLAEGFFEYNLGDSEVLTMFLTVVACGYVAGRSRPVPESLPEDAREMTSARIG